MDGYFDTSGLDGLADALTRCDVLRWSEQAVAPLVPAAHHRLLIRHLQAVMDGDCDRLMVMMPPGSAKSTYASIVFPALFMARWPSEPVIGASHTQSLADTVSGKVQAIVRENGSTLGYGLATEGKERWDATNGSTYRAVGVGGPLSGIRASLVVLDDPIRNRADAESATIRDKIWAWYSADLLTRLKPGGRVVLIMTRFHEDDLVGRLLEAEPERWTVLCLPAIAGDNDALGRAPGELLWTDGRYAYGPKLLAERTFYERTGNMADWWSLYQQSPRTPGGGLFQTARIGAVEAVEQGGRSVRAWDLAATREASGRDPDWTVGVLLTRTTDQRWIIADVVRLRGGPSDVEAAIKATAQRDGRSVRIGLPQDPGQAGVAQLAYLTRQLAGWTIEGSRETGDKATRAAPVAAQCNVGNVSMLRAGWNRVLIDELGAFPGVAHDDQVDALSRAFAMLVTAVAPATRVSNPFLR